MKKQSHFRSLEDTLVLLGSKSQKGPVSLERILKILAGKGRYLLVIILSIPFCLPVQIPGLSAPFGLSIAFIGIRIAFGKHVWLPESLLEKRVPASTLKKISKKGLWIVKKIRRFIHPRMEQLCHNRILHVVNGSLIVLLGLILALPLPIPLTNLAAAWSMFFLCLGLIEDDGIWVIMGYVLTLVCIGFFITLGFLINHAVQ